MVLDVTRDELRGLYKAIGIAKKETHLKAIDLAVMPSTELAIKCLRQVDAYTVLEAKILTKLKETVELFDVVEEAEILDDSCLFSPTEIGKLIGLRAVNVNFLLIQAGLQHEYKVNGIKYYALSHKGGDHGISVPTYKGGHSIRWKASAIKLIKK